MFISDKKTSTASDLNLLDFNMNNLSGSRRERQFKSHPCNLRGSCPIYQARTMCSQYLLVAVTACAQLHFDLADLLAPCKCHKLNFSGGRGLPRGALSEPWHRSCWHRTHPGCSLLLAQVYGSEGEQPARSWLQDSLHQQACQLLCTLFFPISSGHTLPCIVALTGITITMWVL